MAEVHRHGREKVNRGGGEGGGGGGGIGEIRGHRIRFIEIGHCLCF